MKQYKVTGMSCAACSARVEKAVSGVPGVTSCYVNLLTNSMGVEGTAAEKDIMEAVIKAGYGIKKYSDAANTTSENDDFLKDNETSILKKRLFSSLIFLVILMYFSMGHTMFKLPLPSFFEKNPLAIGLVQMLLSLTVMIINRSFFVSGFKSFMMKSPNMYTLVALGSGASFVYSTYTLFAMTDAYTKSNLELAHSFVHEFYFESAAMILALITVGKMLEAHSKGKTTNALQSLLSLAPKTATIISHGVEKEISATQVKEGDIFIVKPGASIPADGIVIEGFSAVNESALTGESIPVDKEVGDSVSAATVNHSGFLKCQATKVGENTVLSQIIKMVSDASATKAPIAKIADKVSGIFVPVVITIAVITTLIWLFAEETFGFALSRGISVLVISCPCALGLATPVAIMVGNGVGAKNGILFKNAIALEQTGKIEIIALDKTGTITTGEPIVTDITPIEETTKEELLALAYSIELKSEHPLAKAIVKKAQELKLSATESHDFEVLPGNGITATINGCTIIGGSMKFVSGKSQISKASEKIANDFSMQGKTPIFFCKDNSLLGIIAVADKIKDDSPEAIRQLKNMGIKVVMLTGDNEYTANSVKEKTGVDEVIAGVLPAGKENVIKELKKRGKTAMVGDGINDAPALTSSDIGIAIGAGTDVAIDAADIVLMKNRLTDVAAAIRLSRKTLKNIHENLFWAFIYNIIGIPLAAGLCIPLFNLTLSPMFGAAAMSLSSFCVVTNALRLNLFNIKSTIKDKKTKTSRIKEEMTMEKIMKIEGMMCGHCEARVKKCLEELNGVTEAIVSYQQNNAIVKLSKDISDDILKKAVENQGYTVID